MRFAYAVNKIVCVFYTALYSSCMSTDKTASFPLRMPGELLDKIKQAVSLTGLSQQDVMRLCLRIGLKDLERINWDIAGLISQQAAKTPAKIVTFPPQSVTQVAETPAEATGTDGQHSDSSPPMADYKHALKAAKRRFKQAP